jgi:hypothetical protein
MYRLINERSGDTIRTFSAKEGTPTLSEYNWLMDMLQKQNVSASGEYQRKFRAFWRMRCGAKYGRAFFALMERNKGQASVDPVRVAQELYKHPTRGGRKTLEFSFATKLAHTINPHLPIFDSMVKTFYHLDPPGVGAVEDRLPGYRRCYAFLRQEYARVLKEGLLSPAITAFRRALPATASHTDEKVIDWLIWQFVALAREKGWFVRGLCRYK